MSADEQVEDTTEVEEKKSYGFWGRVILFLFIAGPGSVLAFGLWVRQGVSHSATEGASRGGMFSTFIFLFWLFGMIGTAISIFKR